MKRPPLYPSVDSRRATEIRQSLLRDIAAMAPQWRGVLEDSNPDRAVVEIAARLSEEATKRLDQTPERDALAFLEMFNIPPPVPIAAEGVAVFALKENQDQSVLAKSRTGLNIETPDGSKAPFETMQDFKLQASRISLLATVDPLADRIEIVPSAVTSLEPDTEPRPRYELLTSAAPDDSAITLAPPVGIATGDLLRIGTPDDNRPVYAEVANFGEDGLTELLAPLGGAPIAAGTNVERMTRLDAFAMPNHQEHGLYIGDLDVLDIKEPATITLRFTPMNIAALLATEGVRFEIWGTNESAHQDPTPDWHPLVPLATQQEDLLLYKSWIGPLDELELAGRKSRWLRIVPERELIPHPNNHYTHPLVGSEAVVDSISIGINTEEPTSGEDETVSQVAHNSLPLSRAASFLPFGPEPQRFDIFSIAAPQAFTKSGAIATLNFDLLDATLMAISSVMRFDDEQHLYGIGRNGQLQVVDLSGEDILWREFAGPTSDEGSEKTRSINPDFGVHVIATNQLSATSADNLVIVLASDNMMYASQVCHKKSVDSNDVTNIIHNGWKTIPALPQEALQKDEVPELIVAQRGYIQATDRFDGFLYAMTQSGVYFMRLDYVANADFAEWQTVVITGTEPTFPAIRQFVPVSHTSPLHVLNIDEDTVFCLTLDNENIIWVLIADHANAYWIQPHQKTDSETEDDEGKKKFFVAAPGTQPSGLFYTDNETTWLALASISSDGIEMWKLEWFDNTLLFDSQRFNNSVNFDNASKLIVNNRLAPIDSDMPHVLIFDRRDTGAKLVEWAPDGEHSDADASQGLISLHRVIDDDLAPAVIASKAVALFSSENSSYATIALAGDNQSILFLQINPSYRGTLSDWIESPEDSSDPDRFSNI